MFSGVGKQMVNAEFSRIYHFVKLLVNEGFLAVERHKIAFKELLWNKNLNVKLNLRQYYTSNHANRGSRCYKQMLF